MFPQNRRIGPAAAPESELIPGPKYSSKPQMSLSGGTNDNEFCVLVNFLPRRSY
jgi:hypothetical protein